MEGVIERIRENERANRMIREGTIESVMERTMLIK